ncbi:CPBP family intramembrane metalloprotease [Paenibacillus sp. CC-CFT747]|nr:CPBP family intramembrane metalloprotease [Paenibacillus sp. CC-CFT747]
MKKWKLRKLEWKTVDAASLDDRTLLFNLYLTQGLTFLLGAVITLFQRNPFWTQFPADSYSSVLLWGAGVAAAVLTVDLLISRWVPEEITDDGGINERLFGNRSLWHLVLICLIVALCEEILFRGAVQHALGAYWTSILFAAIHVRYLRHWLMTGMVFSISYGLGWIYIHTGSLLAPVAAHFLIDLVMGLIIRYRKKD